MTLSKTLLLLLDVFFLLMLILLATAVGFILYMSFISELPFYIVAKDSSGQTIYENLAGTIFEFLSYVSFIVIIYYLRKGIRAMMNGKFFNKDVAKNLKSAGILLTLTSVLTMLIHFFKDLFNGLFQVGVDPLDMNSKIFMVIIGLFLMLMAQIVKEGIALKSENDLTI